MQSQPHALSAYPWCQSGGKLCPCVERSQDLGLDKVVTTVRVWAPENEETADLQHRGQLQVQTTGCLLSESSCWKHREGYTGDSTDHIRSIKTDAVLFSASLSNAITAKHSTEESSSFRLIIITKSELQSSRRIHRTVPTILDSMSVSLRGHGACERSNNVFKSRYVSPHRCMSSSVRESELCRS